mgnify:CR=1 FL=1
MPNTSTIKEVLNVREWSGDKGTFYYFQLEMDNGDLGTIGKKSKDALKAGDSLTYEIEVTDKATSKPISTPTANIPVIAKSLKITKQDIVNIHEP